MLLGVQMLQGDDGAGEAGQQPRQDTAERVQPASGRHQRDYWELSSALHLPAVRLAESGPLSHPGRMTAGERNGRVG